MASKRTFPFGVLTILSGLVAYVTGYLYADETKRILNAFFGRVFGIAPSDVPFYIIVGLFAVFFIACLLFTLYYAYGWFKDRQSKPGKKELRSMPLDPSLLHLTIHYSRRSDTADHPTRPYYIVNANAKSAFWVPDYMNAAARQGRIQGVRHDGENTLREYLRKEKISPSEGYPTDLAQLGLAKSDLERILSTSS
jgi:hypothetical protein